MRLVLSSALLVMFGCSLDAIPSRGRESKAEAATATPPTFDAGTQMYAAAGKRAELQDAGAPHTAGDAGMSDAAVSDAMTPEPPQKPSGMKAAPSAPNGSAAMPGSSNSPGSSDSPDSKGSSSKTPQADASASSGKPGQPAHNSSDSPDAAPPNETPDGHESHGGRHERDSDSSSEERGRDSQQRDDDSTDRSSDDSSDDDDSSDEGQTPNGGGDHNDDSSGSASELSGALFNQIFSLVDSILALSLGGPQPRDISRLVEAIIGLVAVPVDQLTGSDLGRLLTDLSETEACTNSDIPQCTELCSLLASDCGVCANDTSCLKAARRMCEPLGIRTCR